MLYKHNEPINKNYDVIIIGSGLGGMTAANKMAKDGLSVLLLEAHNKLGGFATWFYRKDRTHVFDISLHGFPVGMKKTCRKYWNQEIADHIIQIKDVRFVNPQFNLQTAFTKEDFIQKLIEHFGVPESQVLAFFKALEEMNFYDQNQMTNGQLFEKFFPGRNDVIRFVMEAITYANGSTLEDPAISYGIVFSNFMSKGVYSFKGGTDHVIKMMKDELLKNNVDIKMHVKVEKIAIENGKAIGVYIDGNLIKSRSVLSNANIKTTINKLVGDQYFPPEYLAKSNQVRLNTSSAQVYIGIKPGVVIPHIGDLIFTSTAKTYNTDELLAKRPVSRTFSVYYAENRPYDETPRYAIVSSTNNRYEDWKDLSEEEYESAKKQLIDDTLSCLEQFVPNINQIVDYIEAATPLTIERFTHHPNGTSFGTKFEGLEMSMSLHHQIPGLFHTGSVGIIMSGWLGAANYGVIQSNEIEKYLAQG